MKANGHLLIIDFVKDDEIMSDEVHNGFVPKELNETLIELGFSKANDYIFYSERNMFKKRDASIFILDAMK